MNSLKLFYLSTGLLAMSIILLITAVIVQRHTQTNQILPAPAVGYGVGEVVPVGSAEVQVAKITFSNGQPGFTAPADKRYLIVELTVKNNANQPIDVLPSSDTYIKNTAGHVSYLTPYGLKQPFRAGKLLPGEQITGQLSYLTAKKGSLKLFVDSIWSGGVIPFKVQ